MEGCRADERLQTIDFRLWTWAGAAGLGVFLEMRDLRYGVLLSCQNCRGDRMRAWWNWLSTSKSLSPVMMALIFPGRTRPRIMRSLGSRQAEGSTGSGSSNRAFCWSREMKSATIGAGTFNLWISFVWISSKMALQVTI